MEKKLYELKIDPEFQEIIPPLKDAEKRILEANLMEQGCITPIFTWGGVIVDGHNRYRICKEHGIPFEVEEMDFNNRDEVKIWILKNQLGRRNLTAFQRCEMVLPMEKLLRKKAEDRRKAKISSFRKSGVSSGEKYERTRDILGEMAGVSHGTFVMAKKVLLNGDEETIQRVRNGSISINWAYRSLEGTPLQPKIKDTTNLIQVKEAVSSLIEKISMGEASPKVIIAELNIVSELIQSEIGR